MNAIIHQTSGWVTESLVEVEEQAVDRSWRNLLGNEACGPTRTTTTFKADWILKAVSVALIAIEQSFHRHECPSPLP